MTIGTRVVSRTEVNVTLSIFVLLFAIAVPLTWRAVWPKALPPVHTQIAPGMHLTFVLLAPTSDHGPKYQHMVRDAMVAMARYADSSGLYFSTVGISDHWSVDHGMDILKKFGAFDEVIVGRNAFNTGVEQYITVPGALPAFPQIVVMLRERWVQEERWAYGKDEELIRVIGSGDLAEWSRLLFAVSKPAP